MHQVRIWAGLGLMLALALAEIGLASQLGHGWSQGGSQPGPAGEIRGLEDWLANR